MTAAAPQWISVAERLPEEGAVVLAYDNCEVVVAGYDPENEDGPWALDDRYITPINPTHWMPLPEAPK